jgi:hypothetical protein
MRADSLPLIVMARIVPAIHVLLASHQDRKTWMPGMKPSTTG